MNDIIRIQTQVATGRLTLPVTIFVCLLLWFFTFNGWDKFASMGIIALIGYVMIETNTAFNLIRTRTTLPVCIYGWIATSLFFLHPFSWENLVPLTFVLSIYQLFHSYESPSPTNPIYHAFLFIGLGSLALPQFMTFACLWWISMIPFRAIGIKSFLASLIGLITPYWFLFAYAFYFDEMNLFLTPLQKMIHFYPINYSLLSTGEIISWTIITLLLLISSIHYGHIAYKDKTRTRIYHSFLVYTGIWTTLLCVLQPEHLGVWMSIQLICMAFLCGHLFTLTRNRFSGILFIVTFVVFILLMSLNLWMQFFNS